MVRYRGSGWSSSATVRQRAVVPAVLAMLLLLTSCATMFNGATQLVPVTSSPERAEVFVDGVSMGFTPVELTLRRNVDVTVDVRLGDRTRSFVLQSETQGAMVGLDLVPVGAAGGLVLFASSLGASLGGTAQPGAYAFTAGLLGASLAPVAVDFGTGALFRLRPMEIVAVFE
ncbi:MAG: PEGA domain-containing protein [Trueperaceae bacterium]|nr:PEGA domain-containing protein [Trueperaceae bacterium]